MKNCPNVILIGIDTLRADHLGAYGYKIRQTSPNIDDFAKSALLFKNCRAQAPHTAPSFMSIMTGRYPTHHGVTLNMGGLGGQTKRVYGLDKDIPTLAEVLKKNGYRTGAFTDGGQLTRKLGFAKGFDYYSMNLKDEATQRENGIIPQEEIFYWLKEASTENFFLFFHTYAVHSNWLAPEQYRKMFTPDYRGPLDKIPLHSEIKENVHGYVMRLAKTLDQKEIWHYEAMYDGAIRYVDDFFGELINYLSDLKLLDNTIIIFTSDHGEEFMDHGKLSHEQLYRELLHVPLIIKIPPTLNPKVYTSNSISQLVRSVDIFPTILDLLGLETELTNGVSLLQTLGKDLDLPAIAESLRHGIAIENKNLKYIFHRLTPNIDELYKLDFDPREKNNVALKNLKLAEEMLYAFDTEHHRIQLPPPRKRIIYFDSQIAL